MTAGPRPIQAAELEAIPEGRRLLHIGPPKTGTTTLQTAFHRARDEVLEQGVRYIGPQRHSRRAVLAALADTEAPVSRRWDLQAGNKDWERIAAEVVEAREPRLLFSSERLAHADAAAVGRVVDLFEPSRVHVVATLRPLWKVMPSQWQQGIQAGSRESQDAWLERVFAESADDPKSFWHWQRHDRLIARWAEAVGIERMLVVVVDESDHAMVLRAFERLLALRPDTLGLHSDLTNRSLTVPEVESLRAFNRAVWQNNIPIDTSWRLIKAGPNMKRRTPAKDEPRIRLPDWAAPRVAAIADEIVAGIEASGVQVVGELGTLASPAFGVKPDARGRTSARPSAAAFARRSLRRLARRARGVASKRR